MNYSRFQPFEIEESLLFGTNRRSFKKRLLTILAVVACFLIGACIVYFVQSRHSSTFNKIDYELSHRRDFIRQMTRDAWNAYMQHAWGAEALRPIKGEPYSRENALMAEYTEGMTIVESLSTLWIMDLKEEFEYGRQWVKNHFNPSQITYKWIYSPGAVTNYIGSLLSCYALTNDSMFLVKAEEMAFAIKRNIGSYTAIYANKVFPNGSRGEIRNRDTFSTIGGQHLELRYLSDLTETGAAHFWRSVANIIRSTLKKLRNADGVYRLPIHSEFRQNDVAFSLQKGANQFYGYLIKAYIQSNGTDSDALETYSEAIKSARVKDLIAVSSTGFIYTRDYLAKLGLPDFDYSHPTETMNFEGCNLGAIFGLLLPYVQYNEKAIFKHLAGSIVQTCQMAATQTEYGLVPSEMHFEKDGAFRNGGFSAPLTPEFAESNFVLERITNDPVYRENAWHMAVTINQHCRTAIGGFKTLKLGGKHDTISLTDIEDYQPPSFIGGTLKYLYLTFAPNLLPLNKWVFNAVGQPLPVCGQNDAYPIDTKCY